MSQHEQNRTDVDPEELQPCLDYGKKAYEAIMKADLPEAAAAIEGHCTFVPGSSLWVVEKVWKDYCSIAKNGVCENLNQIHSQYSHIRKWAVIYCYKIRTHYQTCLVPCLSLTCWPSTRRCWQVTEVTEGIGILISSNQISMMLPVFFDYLGDHREIGWNRIFKGSIWTLAAPLRAIYVYLGWSQMLRWDWVPEEMPMECPWRVWTSLWMPSKWFLYVFISAVKTVPGLLKHSEPTYRHVVGH